MNSKDEHSARTGWSELFGSIATDMRNLLAHDLELAKHEMQEGAGRLKSVVVMLATGALLGLIGAFMLVFAVVYLLSDTTELPLWASYGIVGFAVIIIAGALFLVARSRASRIDITPQRAAEAFKEDLSWMSSRISKSWQNVNKSEPH